MDKSRFDLAVSYSEIIQDAAHVALINEFVDEVRSETVNVDVETREEMVLAAVEWYLPTAIVLFVTRKYFDTLLSEAAKEHYPVLKRALVKLVKKTIGAGGQIFLRHVVSENAALKASGEANAFSIYAELRSGQKVKFVFENSTPTEELESCTEAVLTLLRAHHEGDAENALTLAVDESKPRQLQVFRYDPDTKTWRLVTALPPPKKPSE